MISFLLLQSLVFAMPTANFKFVEKPRSKELWHYSQRIEHQKPEDHRFQQRVYIDRQFSSNSSTNSNSNSSAPIFLKVCGEQSCPGYFSPLAESLARNHQGFLVAVEHRYYGSSHPFTELTTDNLKHLHTQAALDDLKNVIRDLRRELGLRGPIVAIGCSYPGSLAAFLRTQSPELVDLALSASAPVHAKTFLPEADRRNARVIFKECVPRLRRQIRRLEKLIDEMNPTSFANFARALHFKEPASKASVIDLLGDLPSNWAGTGNHRVFCERLGKAPTHLGPLIESFARYIEFGQKTQQTFEWAQKTSVQEIGPSSNIRQWLYQTCTEYGYFQITDPDRGVGPLLKNADHKRKICKSTFGHSLWPQPDATNHKFARVLKASGSKILFLNSRQDFWSHLSITPKNNTNPRLETQLFESGGHCSALYDFPKGKPGPQARAAHDFVKRHLKPISSH